MTTNNPHEARTIDTTGLRKKLVNALACTVSHDYENLEERAYIAVNHLRALADAIAAKIDECPEEWYAVQFMLLVDLRGDSETEQPLFTFRTGGRDFDKECAKKLINEVLK